MGRPKKLDDELIAELVKIIEEQPYISQEDLVFLFRRRTGVSIATTTARNYLKRAGVRRTAAPRKATTYQKPTSPEEPRYGYTDQHRDPGDAVRYPCGLTDSEWERVRHLFDPAGRPGRPPKYARRLMLDACVYLLRSGCSWRMLPKDFPPWKRVYATFRRWQAKGLFEEMHDELRALWRSREHRLPDPTAGALDSQSVPTSPQGGPTGYDAAKKVKGRKRHLVTDTLGLVLAVVITTANVPDRDAADASVGAAIDKYPTPFHESLSTNRHVAQAGGG